MSEDVHSGQDDAYHKIAAAPAAEPRGCPVDAEFTPFDANYLDDPYPQLAQLMAEAPICYSAKLGYLVVTGMDNVVAVLRNHADFSSANVQDPVLPVCTAAQAVMSTPDYNPQAVMSNCQQPDHTRIRRFTQGAFNARRMRLLEPYIRQTTDELIDAMLASQGAVDFVAQLAHPLPGRVIFRLIGFPPEDDAQLIDWTANRLMFTWGQPTPAAQTEIAGNMLSYWRYCRAFVASRLAAPGDDLTSELLAAHHDHPDLLSLREVESIVYGLSFAGHEIVSNFLSLALKNLLDDRGIWQHLCADQSLIANALEEVLRFDSPQTSWRRVATRDLTFKGVEVPKGTRVFLSLGAANRDASAFDAAENFDVTRGNANKHVSFGHGIHFCLGARLARLEAQIALETLCRRMPDLRIVPGQRLRYSPNMTFRGPTQLWVEWDAVR